MTEQLVNLSTCQPVKKPELGVSSAGSPKPEQKFPTCPAAKHNNKWSSAKQAFGTDAGVRPGSTPRTHWGRGRARR